jgi:chromosome segregation ATPase
VHDKAVKYFKGDLQDYRLMLIELEREQARAVQSNQAPKQGAIIQQNRKAMQAEIRRHSRTIEQAEKKIGKVQDKLNTLDLEIAKASTPSLLSDRQLLVDQIKKLETEWVDAQTQLDTLEK